jgi:DNA-binding IscR family transcriptional regulator
MQMIARDYAAGKCFWTSNRLSEALDVPSAALSPVLECLEAASLIVATEKEHWLPARSMETIPLIDLMMAVRSSRPGKTAVTAHATPAADELMRSLEDAMRERLGTRTLKDLADGG